MVQSLMSLQHNVTRSKEPAFFTGETQSMVLSFLPLLRFILRCWGGCDSSSYRETTLYILFQLRFSARKISIPRLQFPSSLRLNILFSLHLHLQSVFFLLQVLAD